MKKLQIRKITTVHDARQEKHMLEAQAERRAAVAHKKMIRQLGLKPIYEIRDAQDGILGRCESESRAKAFIADSLNTAGWTINKVTN